MLQVPTDGCMHSCTHTDTDTHLATDFPDKSNFKEPDMHRPLTGMPVLRTYVHKFNSCDTVTVSQN